MKKSLQRKCMVAFAMVTICLCGLQAQTKTVELETAGTLATELGEESKTITDLTVKGPINSADFATLLSMGENYALTALNLGDAVLDGDSIPSRAMTSAKKVESLVLPKTTARIGTFAFAGLAISSLELPATLEYIGEKAFRRTEKLETLTLAEGNKTYALVDGILYSADKKVLVLCPATKTGEISIPDGVTRIENSAFDYCAKITSIKLPASVEEIGNDAFYSAKTLSAINLDQVKEIGNEAFGSCSAFVGASGKLSLPNVKTIGSMAFVGLDITELETGDALETIGESAFWTCAKLTKVTLGKNLKEVGSSAFHVANLVNTVYCYAEVPPVLGGYNAINSKFEEGGTLYVPKGSLDAYKSANIWKQVKNIQEMTSTSIDQVAVESNTVTGIQNGVVVNSATNVVVRIYNAGGSLLKEQSVSAGVTQISLSKGLYIVSLNGEKGSVVIVR